MIAACAGGLPLANVPLTGTVAILTAHRQLCKRRISIRPRAVRHRLRAPAVAADALRQNQPAEPIIPQLVAGRETPGSRLGVIRQGRLEQVAVALDYKAEAVLAGPENISQRPHLPKDFLSGAVDGVLVLVKLPFFSPDFKELSSFLVKHLEWYGKAFDERLVVTGKHRAPHSRFDVAGKNPRVTRAAEP